MIILSCPLWRNTNQFYNYLCLRLSNNYIGINYTNIAQPFTWFNLFLILMLSLFAYLFSARCPMTVNILNSASRILQWWSYWVQHKVTIFHRIFIYHKHVIIIIVSTQTTNYKRNLIRRFPFPRRFLRVGWHFLVNASLNNVKTLFSGRIDISETKQWSFCKPLIIFMRNAGCSTFLHSIYDYIW